MIHSKEYSPEDRPMHSRALDRTDWACQMIGKRTDFTTDWMGTECHVKKLSCIHRQINQLQIN